MVGRCSGCDGRDDGAVVAMLQWQKVSDLLIGASLLSIPLELLYFATCATLRPLRQALLQLGTFVVMCGLTHLLYVFAYERPASRRFLQALTTAKILGALTSTAAAISLPVFFPRLLRLKVREAFLRTKARQLNHDLAAVRRREETAWRVVRAVTHHIRDSTDARTILRTTMLQLADALGLHNCAVWMPHRDGVLRLVHQLLPHTHGYDAPQVLDGGTRAAISVRDPDVADVVSSAEAKVLRLGSALGAASGGGLPPAAGAAAAIRMPMLRVSNFHGGCSTAPELANYAILVLVLPPNGDHRSPAGWNNQDLEIVQAVADQVAVALAHAAALEESQLIRHKLSEQHRALLHAKHEVVSATKARNSAHSAMRDAVRAPMHPVIGLVSVMQQEAATAARSDQRLLVDALATTSALSSTLTDDVMETLLATMDSRDPPLSSPRPVARRPFELRSLIRDVASVAGCLSGCRGFDFSHQLETSSLPEWVVGDDKRIFHLLLHMVGAVLSRRQRHVTGPAHLLFSVCSCNDIVGEDQHWILVRRHHFSGGNQVFVKFQVGLKRPRESDPAGSLPASRPLPPFNLDTSGGADMQLSVAMCQKMVQMMNGNMWSASDPEGFQETMTLVLRFQLQQSLNPRALGSGAYRIGASSSSAIPQHQFNGLRVLLVDSDAMSLEVTQKLLQRLGCQVVPVSSGLGCLSLLGSTVEASFQLVVLDLDAHGGSTAVVMNGFEVALRIRELTNTCWLLVLVVLEVSNVDDRIRDMCRRAGVNGLIEKPITLPALGAQLQRVLQNN